MKTVSSGSPGALGSSQPASGEKPDDNRKSSYRQILKSSALIGGSSVLVLGIGLLRTKAIAVLLGPMGVGLFGLYTAIVDLAVSLTGVGVNSSGVRQVAEAVGSGDSERVARTAAVLRRTSLWLGVIGALLLAALAVPIASLTFGSTERSLAVALLALAVLFKLIADGRAALIQGTRRLRDLAKMQVIGALVGTGLGVLAVYVLGEPGVVTALVLAAASTLAVSWWYSRRLNIPVPALPRIEMREEQRALLKLGVVFMSSAVMMMASAYLVRILVTRHLGIEAAGLYQAAWAVGGLYIGLVLNAMAADFYPRLTGVASDNQECNRIVNEQATVSLLLAGPGVLATMTLAPLVISILYSREFLGAVDLLRWLCLGVSLRVISWPLGFILVAKGDRVRFFASEVGWTFAYLSLAWFLIPTVGLEGAGAPFAGAYLFQVALNHRLASDLSGFQWSSENKRSALEYLLLIGVVFTAFQLLTGWLPVLIGALAVAVSTVRSLRDLAAMVSLDRLPASVTQLLRVMRLAQ